MFWWPAYRLAGVLKLVTALVSWGTVLALIPITPRALAMRGPDELERRVSERTAELAQVSGSLGAEVVERRRAEETLREQREWFRVTLSSIGDAVIVAGLKGEVSFLNPTAESLTGWSRVEAEGRPLGEVLAIRDEELGRASSLDVDGAAPPRARRRPQGTGRAGFAGRPRGADRGDRRTDPGRGRLAAGCRPGPARRERAPARRASTPRERGAVPHARRLDPATRLDGRPGRVDRMVQPPLV